MRTLYGKYTVLIVLLGLSLFFVGCSDSDSDNDSPTTSENYQNNFPVVQNILITPDDPVYVDDIVTLTAVTSDPDDDVLRYSWTKTAGEFDPVEATGESLEWTAPASNGTYEVTVYSDDGNGGTSNKAVDIPVYGGNQSGTVEVIGGARLNPVGGTSSVGYVDAGDTITLVWDVNSTVTIDATRPDQTKYAPDGSQVDSTTLAVVFPPQYGYAEGLPTESAARYSIVGKLESGSWFAFTPGADTDGDGIPESFSAVAPSRGKVYLSVNEQESLLLDNTGNWTMDFTITRP
jgi:hypothetical protein